MPISSASNKSSRAESSSSKQSSNWSTSKSKGAKAARSLADPARVNLSPKRASQESTSSNLNKSLYVSSIALTSSAIMDQAKTSSSQVSLSNQRLSNVFASEDSLSNQNQPSSLSIGGQLVLTGSKKQHNSIGFIAKGQQDQPDKFQSAGNKSYLSPNELYVSAPNISKGNSQSSISQGMSTNNNSTAHLHSLSQLNPRPGPAPLSIRRNVNLKYVKTLIICLMAVDLLITVLIHQFSNQDQVTLWFTTLKMRFSLLNLMLSTVWFVVQIGAILFDIYPILLVSSLVHVASFFVLLVLSLVHFTRRIDYNTVNLTSFLLLLFSIIFLHVYLLVMAALNIHLTMNVKQRKRSPAVTR